MPISLKSAPHTKHRNAIRFKKDQCPLFDKKIGFYAFLKTALLVFSRNRRFLNVSFGSIKLCYTIEQMCSRETGCVVIVHNKKIKISAP